MIQSTENPFQASWSEQGHTICLGHWEVSYRGVPLHLPPTKSDDEMGTFGIYSYLYPDDPEFAEGLEEDEWIVENMEWIAPLFEENSIPLDEEHLSWFYHAINSEDWRCGSCGGCI